MSKHLRIELVQEKRRYRKPKRESQRSLKKSIKKNPHNNYSSTQQWLPTDSIEVISSSSGKTIGLLKTKSGKYVSILEISPQNFNLKSKSDRNDIIHMFEKMIKIAPTTLQFKIITEKTNLSALIERVEKSTDKESSSKVIAAKSDYIKFIENLSQTEASSKRFFMIYEYSGSQYTGKIEKDVQRIAREMEQIRNTLASNLRSMGNDIVIHSDEKAFLEDFLYRYLNKRSSLFESVNARKNRLKWDTFQIQAFEGKAPVDRELSLNSIISPRGMDFTHSNYCLVDGVYYTHLFIQPDSYPEYVYATWNNCFLFGQGTDVDMFFVRQDRDRVLTDVMRRTARMTANLKNQKEVEKENTKDVLKSADYIKESIRTGKNFYYGMIVLTLWDYNLQSLKDRKGDIILALKANEIKVIDSLCICEQAFRMTLPLGHIDDMLFNRYQRNFMDDSVACCYPFDEFRLYDPDGWVLGLTGNGASLATFNNFNTSNNHANANIGIFGTAGSGKTYLQLALSRRFRLHDIGVMFILPVKGYEYKLGVEDMDGLFIDLSPGSTYCINIMEIRAEAELDAALLAEMEITSRSKLQQKITQIVTFVQLLLDDERLNPVQTSDLETVLSNLYARYGITQDNRSLYDENGSIKKMPILNDLYNDCKKMESLAYVVSVLTPFITGACSNMNGQTNVDLNNKMIALDVSNTGDRYLPAFTFIALDFAYDKIKENLYDMWALFIDEAWKMMVNVMTELFVNELIKIVRGYAGSAILGTQNVADIANSQYGESILDNCDTKFILKAGDREAQLFEKLFGLTKEEVKDLKQKERGRPLMLMSNGDKIPLIVKVSEKEHKLFTTDPQERRRNKAAAEAEALQAQNNAS